MKTINLSNGRHSVSFNVFLSVVVFSFSLTRPLTAQEMIALDSMGTIENGFQTEIVFGWSFAVDQTIAVEGFGFFNDFLVDGEGLRNDHRVRL